MSRNGCCCSSCDVFDLAFPYGEEVSGGFHGYFSLHVAAEDAGIVTVRHISGLRFAVIW